MQAAETDCERDKMIVAEDGSVSFATADGDVITAHHSAQRLSEAKAALENATPR